MLAPRWYYLEQDMKNTVIKFAAIAGLLTAMASPANAEHSAPGFVVRSGPVYVSYNRRTDGITLNVDTIAITIIDVVIKSAITNSTIARLIHLSLIHI